MTHLTPRQHQILTMLWNGHTVKQSAKILKVTTKTIEFHRTNLRKKFESDTTMTMIRKALKRGLLEV